MNAGPAHLSGETDSRLRERTGRIVKLRLSQQYDLDIPGIEKYKKPEPVGSIDPEQTSVMRPVTQNRGADRQEGATGGRAPVTQVIYCLWM